MTFDTPFGRMTFDPKTGKTTLYLPEYEGKGVTAHGSLKRMLLTFAFQQERKFALPYVSMN